jgi:asparagine synthase (glutamine-hydrolysing)
MCGIAGIVAFDRAASSEDVMAVTRMMDAQIHRGPDGFGMHRDGRAVLGHRRLAIIDLSDAGRQPMSNEDGTVWVTYNGEIYNFQELREELSRRGHCFKSRTDTEVLVHGYEEWGIEDLLARLRGMFAFGLYDGRASAAGPRLILAKDRFGIKPLYYSYRKGLVIFASEVQALLKSGMVPRERDPEALARFLQLGSVPVPLTTIKSIQALPAAHYAIVDERGLCLSRYWDLAQSYVLANSAAVESRGSNLDQASLAARALLDESVRGHLLSDVPLGVFLSGGLDSSALVAVASRFRDKPVTTVSIVFEEAEYSESPYSTMVAKRYGTDHREVLVRSKDLIECLPRLFAAMDQPTVDGVNTYLVSKAAKEAGLTVVLSGIGGDEVFLGYGHFKRAHTLESSWRLFTGLPRGVRRGLLGAVGTAGPLLGRSGLEKLAYLDRRDDTSFYLMVRGLFAPRQIQDLLGLAEKEIDVTRPLPSDGSPPRSLVHSLALLEFRNYLQNQLLKDADAMSMAWSIETRVPYLDHPLVEYAAALPVGLQLRSGVNKPVLVAAAGDDLPPEVWQRPKMGFTFPFARWLKESAEELQNRCLEAKLFAPSAVARIWEDFRQRRAHWSRPWALVVASQWGDWLDETGVVKETD